MPSSGLIRQLRPTAPVDLNANMPSAFGTVPTWMAPRSQENGSASQSSGRLYLTGFHLPQRVRIDGLGFDVLNAGVSADFFVGLYNSTTRLGAGAHPQPADLIASASLPAITTTGQKLAIMTPATLTPGIYWAGVLGVGTVTTLRTAIGIKNGGFSFFQGFLNTNYLGSGTTLANYNSGNDPNMVYHSDGYTALPNSARDVARQTITSNLAAGVWTPMRLAAA